MGYIRHHSIVVTSWSDEAIKNAHEKAKEIFNARASEILQSKMNDYKSFFIAPDGSKEGWDDSDIGDIQRETFITFINSQAYEDGSNSLKYAELFYGDDEGEAEIVKHN